MHFAQDFDAFPLGLHMVPSVFCKGPHTVGFTSMVCIHFARGTPLGFHWVHLLCKIIRLPYISHGCALGISLDGGIRFARGSHCDVIGVMMIGLHYILQGLLLTLPLDSIYFVRWILQEFKGLPYVLSMAFLSFGTMSSLGFPWSKVHRFLTIPLHIVWKQFRNLTVSLSNMFTPF